MVKFARVLLVMSEHSEHVRASQSCRAQYKFYVSFSNDLFEKTTAFDHDDIVRLRALYRLLNATTSQKAFSIHPQQYYDEKYAIADQSEVQEAHLDRALYRMMVVESTG